MCIYYKDRPNLDYSTKEHIIPASIGGKTTLPREYVSREFNTGISALEQSFIREGLVSMPRQFLSPGKRGSLGKDRATKSKIHVINSAKEGESIFALGYTSLGKTTEIPHLMINLTTNEFQFSFSKELKEEPMAILSLFKEKMIHSDLLKIKITANDKLPQNIVLIGICKGFKKNYDCYIVSHSNNNHFTSAESLKKIGEQMNWGPNDLKSTKYWPRVESSIQFSIEHFRVYGKIAFNFLASKKGMDFVMQDRFDNLREWIAYGTVHEGLGVHFAKTSSLSSSGLPFPESAHYVFLTKADNNLIAEVSLYNGHTVNILLCKDFNEKIELDGLICDWKNQKEMTFEKYMRSLSPESYV